MHLYLIGFCGRKGSGKDSAARLLRDHRDYAPYAFAARFKALLMQATGLSMGTWEDPALKDLPLTGSDREIAIDMVTLRRDELQLGDLGVLAPGCKVVSDPGNTLALSRHCADFLLALLQGEERITPRRIMQQLGTEWGRALDPNIWIRAALAGERHVRDGKSYDPTHGEWRHARRLQPWTGMALTDTRHENEIQAIQAVGGVVVWVDAEQRLPPWTPEHTSEPNPAEIRALCNVTLDNNGPPEALLPSLRSLYDGEITDLLHLFRKP